MEEKKKEIEAKKKEADRTKQPEEKRKKTTETVKRRSENENNNTPKKKAKQKIRKPFKSLLNDVTIVISGIQNPERAELRSKALAMGAKYKPDWDDNTCTHLM